MMGDQHEEAVVGTRSFDPSAEAERCLRGEKLYGDDFPVSAIEACYRDEEEGYYDLGAEDRDRYVYAHHFLNWIQWRGPSRHPSHENGHFAR